MIQSLIITNMINHHHQQQQQQPATVLLMDEILPTHLFSTSSQPTSSISTLHPSTGQPSSNKRKRSLPGHPDPDSEVIALSPNSLLATNRFMCEICNKGFQRDQNLQLHRRGHNLPWKLKQRPKDEAVKKKVYVCPEPGCVHHDPARALGDLTGIKKHFYRKHGEKKWKCDKCSKKYAVQSDWKAHSKTCGTKEYKCDCGSLFSRRDSFITHRAFCDALVEDTARAITSNPFLPPPPPQQQQQEAKLAHDHHQSPAATSSPSSQQTNMFILQNPDQPQLIPQQQPDPLDLIPPWLHPASSSSPSLLFSHDLMQMQPPPHQNPSHVIGGPTTYAPPPPQPHMSATALLQKAAQLGAIVSSKTATATTGVTAQPPPIVTAGFGLNLSSRDHQYMGSTTTTTTTTSLGFFTQGSGGGPANAVGGVGSSSSSSPSSSSLLLHDMLMMKSTMPNSFDGDMSNAFGINAGGISDGLTRDFLGLSPLISHAGDLVNLGTVAGLADTNAEHKKEW